MFKRRLKLLGKILLGFVALVVVFLLIERWRGQIALARFKKELIANGAKLSPHDFVETFNPEDNGAPAAIAAVERLTNGTVLLYGTPPRMHLLPSGRAIIGFLEPEWRESSSYRDGEWTSEPVIYHWEQLIADVEANAVPLAELRTALAKPVLNNGVIISAGANTNIQHLAAAKAGAQRLGHAAQAALHRGDRSEALQLLMLQLRMADLLAENQTIIAELIRMAISALALPGTWEALQAEGWTDAELLRLQQAWMSREFLPPMIRSLEGELVYNDLWHAKLRASNEECFRAFYFDAFYQFDLDTLRWESRPLKSGERLAFWWKKYVFCPTWRFAWSHQAQHNEFVAIRALTDIGQQAINHQSHSTAEQAIGIWTNQYIGGGFYRELRRLNYTVAGLPKSLMRTMRAETEKSLVISALALKRYFLRHGEYPVTMAKLVPEFLAAVPVDFMDGQPIKYQRNDENSFTLYSVGENGRDEGGDATPTKNTRSRHLWLRRDYVWPAPATAEEVEEFRREAAKN